VFGLVPVIDQKRWRRQNLSQFEDIDWS